MFNSHQRLGILLGISCLLLMMPIIANAQTAGTGDGCTTDSATGAVTCPSPPGDSGDTTPSEPVPDADGDGVPDYVDRCPFEPGPAWNDGCPVDDDAPGEDTTQPDSTTDTAPDAPRPNPVRPSPTGECSVATMMTARANVRAMPSLSGDVVGVLDPSQTYVVSSVIANEDGVWYFVASVGGWVSGTVVNVDGNCGADVRPVETTTRVERLPEGEIPGDNCITFATGDSFCFDGLIPLQPDMSPSTASIAPQEQCTLWGDEIICTTILVASADDGSTSGGLVPIEQCTTLPDGEVFCSTVLLGVPRPAGDDAGLSPQVQCTMLDGIPFCMTVLVGIAPGEPIAQTREHILLANRPNTSMIQECTRLADGSEFCYITPVMQLPDDGSTAGLIPQSMCVEFGDGVPFCFTTLTAVLPGADAGAIAPTRECVDFLGEVFCFDTLSAFIPDADAGSTGGLVPGTECTDLQGETICFQTLLGYQPNPDDTSGIMPTVQCTDFLGEVFCFDTLTAFLPDANDTAKLVPGMQCVDIGASVPFCYPVLKAFSPMEDTSTGRIAPETVCTDFLGETICTTVLTASIPDDADTAGIAPEVVCTDFLGELFCYTVLRAEAPQNENRNTPDVVFGILRAPRGGGIPTVQEVRAPSVRNADGAGFVSGLQFKTSPQMPLDIPMFQMEAIIDEAVFDRPLPESIVGNGTCSYFPANAGSSYFPQLNGHTRQYTRQYLKTVLLFKYMFPDNPFFVIPNVLMVQGETFNYRGVLSNVATGTIAGVLRDTSTGVIVAVSPSQTLSGEVNLTAPAGSVYDIEMSLNVILKPNVNWDAIGSNVGIIYADAITCSLP